MRVVAIDAFTLNVRPNMLLSTPAGPETASPKEGIHGEDHTNPKPYTFQCVFMCAPRNVLRIEGACLAVCMKTRDSVAPLFPCAGARGSVHDPCGVCMLACSHNWEPSLPFSPFWFWVSLHNRPTEKRGRLIVIWLLEYQDDEILHLPSNTKDLLRRIPVAIEAHTAPWP